MWSRRSRNDGRRPSDTNGLEQRCCTNRLPQTSLRYDVHWLTEESFQSKFQPGKIKECSPRLESDQAVENVDEPDRLIENFS